MVHRFKELLASGETLRVFSVGRLNDPVTIDLYALGGGFHGFWIDQEHVGMTFREVQAAAVAGRANGLDCFVRMSPIDYSMVTQNLEAGAGGVMAARVESAAQTEQFVQWSKFGPRGCRGVNTSGRDAHYTHLTQAEFAERANREHFVAIQIETLGALDEVEEIAANDGVDLLFVGPSDLSQAFGVPGQKNDPRVWAGIQAVDAACKRHGKAWGTVPGDPEFAKRCRDLGCRMLSIAGDVSTFRLGVAKAKELYKDVF